MVLALTANRFYALRGVRPGTRLAKVARHLRAGRPFQVGRNTWDLTAGRWIRGVLNVRHGMIEEIGIAWTRLTRTRAQGQRFVSSFS